ncbi:MAG: hypothetical protein WC492_03365 [Candidatus Micrarchaeia archaeon]
MNITIDSKSENALLGREEIVFGIDFEKAVPSREQAKQALSTAISIPSERLVIVKLDCKYGQHYAKGFAHVFKTSEAALKSRKYLLKRDKMITEEKKEEKPKEKKAAKK